MDMKDVKSISYDKAFNKKWWESKRAMAARGSGTGKALDEWQKKCTKAVGKMDAWEVQEAKDTCDQLIKCLTVAISKCGKTEKETTEGCRVYAKLVRDFKKQLDDRTKQISGEPSGEEAVLALIDFGKKTLVPANQGLAALLKKLADSRQRVGAFEQGSKKVTKDEQKEELLKEIASEMQRMDVFHGQFSKLADQVSKAVQALEPQVQLARKDTRCRPAVAKYEKDLEAFDSAHLKGSEEQMTMYNDLKNMVSLLKTNATADEAIKEMQNAVWGITENVILQGFDQVVEELKDIAGEVSKVKEVFPDDWATVDQWEQKVKAEPKQYAGAMQTAERLVKTMQTHAKRWPNQDEIKRLFKEGYAAYTAFKTQYAMCVKLWPAIQKRIDELNKLRK